MKHRGQRRRAAVTFIVAIAMLTLAACGSTANNGASAKNKSSSKSTSSSGDYIVGYTGDLSGPLAPLGHGILQGLETYFSSVNAKGGINGHHVKLISLDDKSDPTLGVADVHRLLGDNAKGIFVFFSSVADAVAPILKTHHVPAVVEAITTNLLQPVNKYFYGGDVPLPYEAGSLDSIAAKIAGAGAKVAFINASSAAEAQMKKYVQSLAGKHSLKIVYSASVPTSATSASAEITAALGAHPDVIISGMTDPLLISADQAARAQGYTGPIVEFAQGSSYTTLAKLKDPKLYALTSYAYAGSSVAKGSGINALVAAAKAQNVNPLTTPQFVNGYAQALVMAVALKKCVYPCSGNSLASSLESLGSIDTGGITFGPLKYNGTTHAGITSLGVYRWSKSKNAPSLYTKTSVTPPG